MSAENSADHDAENGGEDLRARYLPVSRKELRRRREAELATQRDAQEQAEAAADELAGESEAQDSDVEDSGAEGPDAEHRAEHGETDAEGADGPSAGDAAEEAVTQLTPTLPAEEPDPAEEPADGEGSAADGSETDGAEGDDSEEAEESLSGGEDSAGSAEPSVDLEDEPTDVNLPAVPAEDPRADEADDWLEDSAAAEDDAAGEDAEDTEDTEDADVATPGGQVAEESVEEQVSEEDPADEPAGEELPEIESLDDDFLEEAEEEAPVPASRRSARLLRETGRLETLTDERLSEIDEITRQAAAVSAGDPNKVDPELLKRQQALAAKAMQENQERRRREQEEADREQRLRRRQRPESEVITRKALRAYAEADEEYRDVATGEIDPVEASGAHGLEIDELVEQTSRQASRQSLMLWLVIILAVLLLIAVGIVLYIVL